MKTRGLSKTPSSVTLANSQAARVISKFGGANELSRLLKKVGVSKNPSSIYRWAYPKEHGGSGGVIPSSFLLIISDLARLSGIVITAEDLDPRPTLKRKKK